MTASIPPSPHRYIRDLRAGQTLDDQAFLISQKDLRTTSNGSLYIHCVLQDKTGQLLARVWQATEAMYEQLIDGGFMRFRGRIESYKGSLQFIIDGMRPIDPNTLNIGDFLPCTEEDIDGMFDRVKEILRQIQNRDVLNLVSAFITDDELMAKFRKAPAAIQMHHAFIGGLLEHTRNVLEIALMVIPRYPQVSLDLVLAGVFLHDLAKTVELEYTTSFSYTNPGQLIGHIVQSTLWIEEKARIIGEEQDEPFPAEIKEALQHIVLSHHGQYEFGSPKLPMTPEAVAVHYLENLDAKLNMYLGKIDATPDADGDWTEYVRGIDTKIFRKDVLGIRPS